MPVENARQLRKRPTDAELKLRSALRQRQLEGFEFRRQVPIGDFVADVACMSERLVIKGGRHDAEREKDDARTAWPNARGYRVIRFWNNDVLGNLDGVVRTILTSPFEGPLRGRLGGGHELELSGAAETSQRHLSFLESGRAAPSRPMVLDPAAALSLSLRQQNTFLQPETPAPG